MTETRHRATPRLYRLRPSVAPGAHSIVRTILVDIFKKIERRAGEGRIARVRPVASWGWGVARDRVANFRGGWSRLRVQAVAPCGVGVVNGSLHAAVGVSNHRQALRGHQFVERMQIEIRQQRADDRALWRSARGGPSPAFRNDFLIEPRLDSIFSVKSIGPPLVVAAVAVDYQGSNRSRVHGGRRPVIDDPHGGRRNEEDLR